MPLAGAANKSKFSHTWTGSGGRGNVGVSVTVGVSVGGRGVKVLVGVQVGGSVRIAVCSGVIEARTRVGIGVEADSSVVQPAKQIKTRKITNAQPPKSAGH